MAKIQLRSAGLIQAIEPMPNPIPSWWNVLNGTAFQALLNAVPKGAIQDKIMS
jgi:hypothetical protein